MKNLKYTVVLASLATFALFSMQGPRDSKLIAAVKNQNYAGVKQALENGENPNSANMHGTALFLAVSEFDANRNADIIELLLANGADPRIKSTYFLDSNKDAIDNARIYKNTAALRLFEQYGYLQSDFSTEKLP